jgi:hypothetical protein
MCKDNSECVKPAICRNGVCQTVAVEAEADAVKPVPPVCEDQAPIKTADRKIGLTRADL